MSAIVLRGAALAFGLMSWSALVVSVVLHGALLKRPTKKERQELAIAQQHFWGLPTFQKDSVGLGHEFVTLRNGVKLHYVRSLRENDAESLIIFIHGFPDSWALWRRLLTSGLAQNALLIGVDLPGYGGSDSIPSYSAEGMLETMTAFIIAMREKYLQKGGKVLTVGHDWGGIINARLAAEAPQLADRFIIASAILPEHVRSNAKARVASSKQMLHTWIRRPLSFRLFKNAFVTLSPVLSQLVCSYYITIFNLPTFLVNLTGSMGNRFFLRAVHAIAIGRPKVRGLVDPPESAESMASCSGPSEQQLAASGPDNYPSAVKQRMHDFGWSEKIRLYREGLILSPWEKSLDTIIALSEIDQDSPRRSSSGAGLFEDGPPGSLKAPATFIYGLKDPVLEPRLCLEGLSDYMVKKSQVVVLSEGAHWLPMDERGAKVIEKVVEWALTENETLKRELNGFKDVSFTVDK